MPDFDLSAFYGQFRDETAENVRRLTDGLLELERQPDHRPTLDAIFRAVHTIKGSARMLGLAEAGQLAHVMESALGSLRTGQLAMTSELNDVLLAGGDALLAHANAIASGTPAGVDVRPLLERLNAAVSAGEMAPAAEPPKQQPAAERPAAERPAPAATPAPPPPAEPPKQPAPAPPKQVPAPAAVPAPQQPARSTVRVRVDRLDQLLNTTGELVIGRQVNQEHATELDDLTKLVSQQQRLLVALSSEMRLLTGDASVHRLADEMLNHALNLTDRLALRLNTLSEQWGLHATRTAALVDELEAEVMTTRLQPLAGLFAPFPRTVRELARALDREVELFIQGEATEADRKIIEGLGEALMHLVRNALDHGIEPPEERARNGKSRTARLTISAASEGGHVRITVADDGRGINPTAVRESAVRKGLMSTEDTALLDDQEALELIFLPGFSTSAMITDISGRGVGLDVVRAVAAELGGRVEIASTLGAGTAITLVMPLTLLTARVLLIEVGGQQYALPSSSCFGGYRLRRNEIKSVEGRPMIEADGRLVPIVQLSELLGIGREQRPNDWLSAVLIGQQGRPQALLVDKLLDEREVVIKPLGPLLENQRLLNGGMIFGDGRVVLLLSPVALLDLAREGRSRLVQPQQQQQAPARLLVSEDSFTTRELIKSILQSAGYQVETAVDGREALDKVRSGSYDLVVSDVEMPHLTGYELTSKIREELGLRDLPVILITSLSREEDRRRGLLAGAQAYIVKSQFDQSNLLDTIRQLLGR